MIDLVLFLLWSAIMFLAGAIWSDRKAAKVERDLKSRIDAQKIMLQSCSQQLKGGREWLGLEPMVQFVQRIEEEAKVYRKRRDESWPGSLNESFNKGAVHASDAAILMIRGWL